MMRHELYRARRRGLNLGRENMSRITANEVFTGLVVMATATRPAVRHSPRVWSAGSAVHVIRFWLCTAAECTASRSAYDWSEPVVSACDGSTLVVIFHTTIVNNHILVIFLFRINRLGLFYKEYSVSEDNQEIPVNQPQEFIQEMQNFNESCRHEC